MPKISIIVPVYNVERYLERCIESILNQTFTDFELILVDDGSTDSSGDICDEYKAKDDRVLVEHKKNGGVSSARNVGIDVSSGKYITFCDSDDYIDSDWLEKLNKVVIGENANSVVGNLKRVDEYNNFTTVKVRKKELVEINNIEERMTYIINILKCKFGWEVCLRLFEAEIVRKNKIRFCEECNNFAEDLGFVLEYALYEKRVVVTEISGYNYFLRSGSMMRNSSDLIKLNELNQVSLFYFKAFDRVMGDKKRDMYPIVHSLLLYNQLIKLDWQGNLHNLSGEIGKIYNYEWFKNNMKQASKEKKIIFDVFEKMDAINLFSVIRYCCHENYIFFRIERYVERKIYKIKCFAR